MHDKCEMFVKGAKNKKIPLIYSGILVLCLILSFFAIGIFGPSGLLWALLIAVGGAYVCTKVIFYFRTEYEYSAAGGELSISVIRNQTSRKTLMSCEIKEIGSFGSVSRDEAFAACKEKQVGDEKRLCCIGDDSENVFFFTVRATDGHSYRVFFAPNDKLLEIMEQKSLEIKRYKMKNC